MGTRAGDVDPGAILHVMERTGMSPADVRRELNEQSGLLGLSGKTADMRALLALERRGMRRRRLRSTCSVGVRGTMWLRTWPSSVVWM